MAESLFGIAIGFVFIVGVGLMGSVVDWLEQHSILRKGLVYDVTKWAVDLGGGATGLFTFFTFQWQLIRRAYRQLREGRP